jgi:S1-C subfamily serine protease
VTVVICAIAVGATACGADIPTDNQPNTPELDPVAAGVGVVANGCGLTSAIGSGVTIDHGGIPFVVSVAHTIRGATEVLVVDATGDEHAAQVVSFDKDADLAALRVPTLTSTPLSLGDFVAGPGSMITWDREIGVEQTAIDVVKRLRITIEDIYNTGEFERTGLEIAGPVESGDSGGPVLNEADNVIGIIYANSRQRGGVGFATDTAEIRKLLDSVTDDVVDTGRCV